VRLETQSAVGDAPARTLPAEAIRRALADAGLLVAQQGQLPERFSLVSDDSRMMRPGGLFIAVRGSARDGHDYLLAAEAAGATAAVVEEPQRTRLPSLLVREGRAAAALVAAAAYEFPATTLRHVIAVTGTNGKSTTVSLLRHIFDAPEAPAASIGTIGAFIGSAGRALDGGGGLTTPGPIELQRIIRDLVDQGVQTLALEASSHSLDQQRLGSIAFDAAIFTNLTRDHLDYHRTMEAYLAAKARLLSYLRPGGVAVVNADDASWRALPATAQTVRFSALSQDADVRALDVQFGLRGSTWQLAIGAGPCYPVRLPLIGDFNVANALGAAAAAWALGLSPAQIAARLSDVPQVPGRLEILHEHPMVLRDYAHTPDALERALEAVGPFVRGRVIVVFGAGGDRDRGKRPQMGAIAEKLADVVILTSDNPRTEDPERILDDIEEGMSGPRERIEDRERAVLRALDLAKPDDLVLLAGKGHETYQVRGTTNFPFDEQTIVRNAFASR
jgi:UDP-N-acetylmuramoyl-L-alanyl-D-glutamate--2,6-diaminopimelate ligase